MFQIRHLKDNLPTPRDGVWMGIIMIVGISSLLENAVASVINKVYNIVDGAETDSISLENYLGN